MVSFLTVIGFGFLLGIRHATDPDHVIAVTTIVSRQQSIKHAGLIGILWGFGHTITILIVGSAIILFNVVIPTRIGLVMELSVGLMLIVLGVLNMTGVMRWITERFTPDPSRGEIIHSHVHEHGGHRHAHLHAHHPEVHIHMEQPPRSRIARVMQRLGFYQLLRPMMVGIVHGLAGSAAVALLVLTTIRNTHWAIAYLLVFGIGTIAGMMLITMAIGAPFAYSSKRFASVNHWLGVASGVVSLGFGLLIVFQIGFGNGLFTSHPHWTPH